MDLIALPGEMRAVSRRARAGGRRVGFVPTMGYLHDGHLSLVRRARELTDFVVVSIFVNPTQFGPGEDLDRYPRDLDRDRDLCRAAGVDALFVPEPAAIYPDGADTFVVPGAVAGPLCGASRPGHFRGVATVVTQLFHIVEPDVAVFGQKDYQQLQVIRRMVRDLHLAVEIVGEPTVREPDGLALSSRNAYLSPEERDRALALSRALDEASARVAAGEDRAAEVARRARRLLEEAGVQVDYAEVRHPDTLEPVDRVAPRAVLALAGFVGSTRLIDNRVLVAPDAGGQRENTR